MVLSSIYTDVVNPVHRNGELLCVSMFLSAFCCLPVKAVYVLSNHHWDQIVNGGSLLGFDIGFLLVCWTSMQLVLVVWTNGSLMCIHNKARYTSLFCELYACFCLATSLMFVQWWYGPIYIQTPAKFPELLWKKFVPALGIIFLMSPYDENT